MAQRVTSMLVFDQLRKLFPEIPEACVSIELKLSVSEQPQMKCVFFPRNQKDAITEEFEIVANQAQDTPDDPTTQAMEP